MSQHPTPLGPYSAVDVEGILCVACCYVEGQESIWPLVCIPGTDADDETGDRGVLTEGEVHWEVEEHRVIVIDVQHADTHQDLPGEKQCGLMARISIPPIFYLPPPWLRGGVPHSAYYGLGEESPRDKGKEKEGRRVKEETRGKELRMGDGALQLLTLLQGTYRGAEGGHPPVPGGDGEVIEGDVLSVQLSILPHPQLPFHWGDHELPCQR